jgi:hypothetical protein
MNEAERRQYRTTTIEAFLYVLLRDHLTLGACEGLMRDAQIAGEKGAMFSNEHLAAYIQELKERIQWPT